MNRPQVPPAAALRAAQQFTGIPAFIRLLVTLLTTLWHHFKRWIHATWIDLICLAIAFVVYAICLEYLPTWHLFERYIPMTYNSISKNWEGPIWLAYLPTDPRYITADSMTSGALQSNLLGWVLHLAPVMVLALMQFKVRDAWDFTAAMLGLAKAWISIVLAEVVLKRFMGKMRPTFLAYCKLKFQAVGDPHKLSTYDRQWATMRHCTGNSAELRFALGAFPNGRTCTAFASAVFLAFYLNAQLKAFSAYPTSYWKMILVLSPIFGACLAAAQELSTNNASVDDIVYSVFFGQSVAILAYKAQYAANLDPERNHLYLSMPPTGAPRQKAPKRARRRGAVRSAGVGV